MHREWRGFALVLAILALSVAPAAAARGAVYWGATISGETYGTTDEAPLNTAAWNLFERHAGKKVGILNTSQPWLTFETAEMNQIHARGAIPLLSVGLADGLTLKEVAEGKQDQAIKAWAQAAKAWGHPFFFNPWWEMNGDWYPWGRNPDYVAAWRHFHDVVAAQGASNVTWTWVTNSLWDVVESDPTPYYPGDAYVDWTGIDTYNWGRNPAKPDAWLSPEQTLGRGPPAIAPTLEKVLEIAPNKPIAIVETAATEYGGNKPNWIREMLTDTLARHDQIGAYIWFNWNHVEAANGIRFDWQIESSAASQQAFRAAIGSSFFRGAPDLPKLTKVPPPAAPAGGEAPRAADLSAGGEAIAPRVATSGDGSTTVVWSEDGAGGRSIKARRLDTAGIPQPAQTLSDAGEDAFGADLAAGPDGSATVVWAGFREGKLANETPAANYVIRARRIEADGQLGQIQDLSAVGQDASDPRIAIAPDGAATVVWKRWDGSDFLIKTRRIGAGGVVEEAAADTPSEKGENAVEPGVVVAPDGSATVVWSRFDGTDQIVQARRVTPQGDLATSTSDLSAAGEGAVGVDIAAADDGSATVVWSRSNGSAQIVQARGIDASGQPRASTHDLSAPGGSGVEPQIARAGNGAATVVWDRFDGSSFIVQSRRLGSDAAPLGPATSLSAAGRDASAPTVAAAADGTAAVAWVRSDGVNARVQRRALGADGAPTGSAIDLSAAGRDAGAPQVAIKPDGTPMVIWRRFDGAADVVQAAPLMEPRPESAIAPILHDFGSETVGAGPGESQAFLVSSKGNTALVIESIELTGSDAGEFELVNASACLEAPIAVGSTCSFEAAFAPTAVGEATANVEIAGNSVSSPDAVALTGAAVEPAVVPKTRESRVTPTAIDNSFQLGKPRLNRRRGTALMPVTVPGRGTVTLLGGRGDLLRFAGAGSAKLLVRPGKAKRRKLIETGRARVRVVVTFVPDGGTANSQTKTVRLKKSAR